jgi:hypothetical protein
MLFHDKECFKHRATTKICTIQLYRSHDFNHRVNTKAVVHLHHIYIYGEADTQKKTPQSTVSHGVCFLKNCPTVLPEDGT